MKTLEILSDLWHDLQKQSFPENHKETYTNKNIDYLHGFYHSSDIVYRCSCGRTRSGYWVMTGLKTPAFTKKSPPTEDQAK
jgi:hypothetical protein